MKPSILALAAIILTGCATTSDTAIERVHAPPERADAWVRKPNDAPLFGGDSALARMLGGQVADLFQVRQYLDAVRGGVS